MGYPIYPEHPTRMVQRIYLASSWRNEHQPLVLASLRDAGFEVYDFRNPRPDNEGFHWSAIDPEWQGWNPNEYREALTHPVAVRGYGYDYGAMEWADTGVLLLPSGRSAHIEAGYFKGVGKHLYILMLEPQEPELMYLMADRICLTTPELVREMKAAGGRP